MGTKIVMGYWDCPFCDTKGIKGTVRVCPNCGRARSDDTKFYMKASDHAEVVSQGEYLSEADAAKKGQGEDWQCSYCGSLNSVLDTVCSSCGHERDESDKGYAEMRAREDEKEAAKLAQQARSSSASTTRPKSNRGVIIVGILLALLVAFGIFAFMPHPHEYHITGKDWVRTVDVEQCVYVDESDWYLPEGADLVEARYEVHHFQQVLDHYETRTRSYQERVQIGSHTEYTYRNNGDGTFTEEAHEVPDYGYETRYETYQEPVYRNDPVYATKYYYKIWRWRYKTTVTNTGEGDEPPADPSYSLAENERFGARTATYRLHGHYDDKPDTIVVEVSEARFMSTAIGSTLQVDAELDGTIRAFIDE